MRNFAELVRRTVGLALTLLALCSSLLGQCPLCRGVLFRSKEGQQLISGFDNAVLFLLAFPFLLIGIFAARIALAQRTGFDHKDLARLARKSISANVRLVYQRLLNSRSFFS